MMVKGDPKNHVKEVGFFSTPNEFYVGWIRTRKGVFLIETDGGIVFVKQERPNE